MEHNAASEMEKSGTKNQWIYRITVILYIVGTVICGVVRFMQTRSVVSVLIVAASFLYLLIMPLVFWLFRIKPGYLIAALMDVFIFLAFTLGTAMRWYTVFGWYDLFAHCLSGVLFTLFGICAYHLLRQDKGQPLGEEPWVCAGFSFCFSMMIAGMWEIIEYTLFLITGYDSQNVAATGVGDTMEDMMICLLGTVITCVLLAVHIKKHRLLLFVPAEEFCGNNP